jgi:hypothetical protein
MPTERELPAGYPEKNGVGKAARNERRKLLATYCNNMAVGMTLGGVLLPVLTWASKPESTTRDLLVILPFMLIGFMAAFFLRFLADRSARKIED